MSRGTSGAANDALIERMRALYEKGDFDAIERGALEYWREATGGITPGTIGDVRPRCA